MEFDITTKLLFGSISALGTIALVFFNLSQTRKTNAELLEKFEQAVSRSNKHSVTELFRLIHGLRMDYKDIIKLIELDSCSKIIYALKKTPGLVSYENGKFDYTKMGRSKIFRFVDGWYMRLSIPIFTVLTFFSFGMLAFGSDVTSILGFIFLIPSSSMLAIQLRQRNYDQMIASLVEPTSKD